MHEFVDTATRIYRSRHLVLCLVSVTVRSVLCICMCPDPWQGSGAREVPTLTSHLSLFTAHQSHHPLFRFPLIAVYTAPTPPELRRQASYLGDNMTHAFPSGRKVSAMAEREEAHAMRVLEIAARSELVVGHAE
eukprot:scaffold37763_cov29-Phaeocystis_antarctica.AAC.1